MPLFDGLDWGDPNAMATLGIIAGLGQASAPSALPVPTSMVIGKAAEGALGGAQAGQRFRRGEAEIPGLEAETVAKNIGNVNTIETLNLWRAYFGQPPLTLKDLGGRDFGPRGMIERPGAGPAASPGAAPAGIGDVGGRYDPSRPPTSPALRQAGDAAVRSARAAGGESDFPDQTGGGGEADAPAGGASDPYRLREFGGVFAPPSTGGGVPTPVRPDAPVFRTPQGPSGPGYGPSVGGQALPPVSFNVMVKKRLGLPLSPFEESWEYAQSLPQGHPAREAATFDALNKAGIKPFIGGEREGTPLWKFNLDKNNYEIVGHVPKLPTGATIIGQNPDGTMKVRMADGAVQAIGLSKSAEATAEQNARANAEARIDANRLFLDTGAGPGQPGFIDPESGTGGRAASAARVARAAARTAYQNETGQSQPTFTPIPAAPGAAPGAPGFSVAASPTGLGGGGPRAPAPPVAPPDAGNGMPPPVAAPRPPVATGPLPAPEPQHSTVATAPPDQPAVTERGTVIPPVTEQPPLPQGTIQIRDASKDWQATETAWSKFPAPAQAAEVRMAAVADALKAVEGGTWTSSKADINARFKALGLPQIFEANPTAVQIIRKSNALATLDVLKGATQRFTQMEFREISKNLANEDLQPGAAREIIAETIGQTRYGAALARDWVDAKKRGWRDPQAFESVWSMTNPMQNFVDKAKVEIGLLKGQAPIEQPNQPGPPDPKIQAQITPENLAHTADREKVSVDVVKQRLRGMGYQVP